MRLIYIFYSIKRRIKRTLIKVSIAVCKVFLPRKYFDDYLIQEKFIQYGFSNKIHPGSVNTLRITTMIDPDTQKPFIAYAVHRFGSSESGLVDNLSQGGIAAMIDLDDGRLSKGLHFSKSGEKEIYVLHPVSLKAIYNEQIPNWGKLKDSIIEMAARMPYLKHVGWDVILSNDELFLLEGNHCPEMGLIQMFKPMRDLPSTWNFLKHYKYVE